MVPARITSRAAAALLSVVCFAGADWRQFRGNHADGVAADSAPTRWDEPIWTAELPGRGLSAPIIIGDCVVVTSCSGYRQDRLHVHCFDAKTGQPRWERQFWATGRTMCHSKMSVAAPTPASDGRRIFAFYSSNDLACLDLEGNLQWYRGLTYDYPNASNSLGMASSPIVVGETVIVQVETDDESFAMGLNAATGQSHWRIERPRKANWTSPAILRGKSPAEDLVLLQSAIGVTAVHPLTGETAWEFGDGAATIPSSVVASGFVYVPSNGLTVLRPIADSPAPEIVWKDNKLSPSTASPLVADGRVYAVNRAGVLVAGDAATGALLWQLRLKGPFSGTPVAAGRHLYLASEEGLVQVVRPSRERGEVIFEYPLGETILCTPAVAGGALYLRSDQHLWKLGEAGAAR